ncbi:uncharacterized protein GGS22DRAFT_190845 [Annulohypoxylon maeteangense]|uniref:uncharacterized protein n=1 Tax=Annulohypoxylon maeteangense TaxID=1927788 RepID=UPI002008A889|nr:uncharacterized protein GGS22DRAFT_190845 [Annulohypoxylon maeteangense]KAI0882866.1 hypothetical protein GGS22DRAFT_190845 [Annulohypoxylon maeteangense]
MDAVLDPQEAARLIQSSGQIHMHAFQVAIGVLTGLALCCFLARMAIRLTYQKRLGLDDAFLILAAACLCAATGILYHICYFLYLHSAASFAQQLLPYLLANYDELLGLQKRVYPFLALIWTTTFAVKACFLAFMRPLVWHISRRVNWYYWFIVGFCLISWAFVVADPFIICPYLGADATKCFSSTVDERVSLGLTAFVTVLDILSDIMVVTIPIIVLRGSFLSRSTKFGLAVFLCLSVFMAICAVVRIAGFHYKGLEDDIWEFFWQQTEGAVAVMMASITAFRTLFVKQTNDSEDTTSRSPAGSFFHRLFKRFQSLARAQPPEKPSSSQQDSSIVKLPKIPSPIFTGLRTFIRKNNRTNVSTATFATLDSGIDGTETDYHAALKTQARVAHDDVSSLGQS